MIRWAGRVSELVLLALVTAHSWNRWMWLGRVTADAADGAPAVAVADDVDRGGGGEDDARRIVRPSRPEVPWLAEPGPQLPRLHAVFPAKADGVVSVAKLRGVLAVDADSLAQTSFPRGDG